MGTKYFTLLTRIGEAKLAEAISTGKPLEIAQMGVGDGGGVLPTPDPMQTKLVNEKRRAVINSLSVDPDNTNQMIAEQVIPENEGGFWLREIGLYDVDGDLIAVGNCPETYKPELKEGSGRIQTVRMVLIVSRTDAITLKFDPTVALATRRYADTLLADHVAAVNPHKQYAPIASPAFTGSPAAPTAAAGTSTTQLATTAFVADAVAYAIGLLSGKTEANTKLKLDINDIVGIPQPWPQATAPDGWLKCNGQAFDKSRYPRLAQVYPSGVLPDLRGEFIRGWDDGRGVDVERALLSAQKDGIRNILGSFGSEALFAGGASNQPVPTGAFTFAENTHSSHVGASVGGEGQLIMLDVSRVVPTAPDNRPRNIAFNYIVRAA
ncbi:MULTISPECIES: phage tail protein [Dickeya]|uniref:Phage tail protein n=1 Tax=Dickeya fangzhongdai TaxID=1778540 RepID=A0A2K8QS32_9GAMM|nr:MULTISPECIES: phage tail protein [Dickeya]ATZ96294.1 phage tail protein [Dickeya fangzhongdai]AYH49949.1 phage tail protein [Dickeya fangzhongdai]QOH49738.1 phage tail protein [Dickeya fangzhongdai]QOH54042.1 phage tail protein [Dickeya fangzhongdai]UGA53300.1 phage tail protein [Dickeya fangzhongdai]